VHRYPHVEECTLPLRVLAVQCATLWNRYGTLWSLTEPLQNVTECYETVTENIDFAHH